MNWTVDYGDGPRECTVPHAWRQDVPVAWEGPAVYRCTVAVEHEDEWLVFDGVSYQAVVFIDGEQVIDHRGIWDAFAAPLRQYVGRTIIIEVRVRKNGGPTFPVRDVLSGFLPYVYHTFGGIYGDVRIVRSAGDPTDPHEKIASHRVDCFGPWLCIDNKPTYVRGVLTWGWYPELGHTNPSDEEIRREVRLAKSMGFNTIKFCLWVPRHRFFEILEEEEMWAWLELPLWDPTGDDAKLEAMAQEIERIVLQNRHHRSIVAWTVGCELSVATPYPYRKRLAERVFELTGCGLVKDNSGGAEMYGGDLREVGTFQDFHPYCDTHWYPVVLESLLRGPRAAGPILLGEFNDYDVHRDLRGLAEKRPYWASDDPALNDQGVRWQHDLPELLKEPCRTKQHNASLVSASRNKGAWIRRRVMECVRSHEGVVGYVVTGWRHTPISTSGMVDDDLQPVFENFEEWNDESMLFLVPVRRPPWVNGGNRPGWLDPLCFFEGQAYFRIAQHRLHPRETELIWTLANESGIGWVPVAGLERAKVSVELSAGEYELAAATDETSARWPVWVVKRPAWESMHGWSKHDPYRAFSDVDLPGGDNVLTTRLEPHHLDGRKVVAFLEHEGTVPMPFWRECIQEFAPGVLDLWADKWDRLWAVAPDRALDPDWLHQTVGDYEVLMNRVDTRTYKEHPYVVRKGNVVVTTLRPHGGHGAQPYGVKNNPSGSELLRVLLQEEW